MQVNYLLDITTSSFPWNITEYLINNAFLQMVLASFHPDKPAWRYSIVMMILYPSIQYDFAEKNSMMRHEWMT